MSHREQPEYCDFCDAKTDALKYYEGAVDSGAWLCTICEATPCSNVALYPTVHQDTDVAVLKTIAITTRMILKAIEGSRHAAT